MKKIQLTSIVILVAILSNLSFAQGKKSGGGGGGSVTNPGAVVTFGYCATPGDTACETANRVRSDQNKPYTNGSEGVSAVFNEISGSHDLTIGLTTANRTIVYDFREMATAGNPIPTWIGTPQVVKPYMNVLHAYNAKLLSGCSTLSDCESDYVTALNGGQFTIDRVNYVLQWNPISNQPYVNTAQQTSAVNVHYHKGADGETFTVTPLPNTNTSSYIAGLQGQSGKSTTAAGQYAMGFTMTVKLQ